MVSSIMTPEIRKYTYIAYALVGVGIGATQVGFAAAEMSQPVWLTVSLAVYAFLGGAFGFVAESNISASPTSLDSPPGEYGTIDATEYEYIGPDMRAAELGLDNSPKHAALD